MKSKKIIAKVKYETTLKKVIEEIKRILIREVFYCPIWARKGAEIKKGSLDRMAESGTYITYFNAEEDEKEK